MTARPCAGCGDVIPTGSYCPDCRPAVARPDRGHVHSNNARWKAMSKRLRKLSPFCEFCGTTEPLAVDHILPATDYPELAYADENCRVLCKSCNGQRGNNFTPDEAHAVLTRLQATYKRRPTTKGRERVNVAQRACDQGGCPQSRRVPSRGKAQRAMKSTMIVNKGVAYAVG